MVSVGRTNIEIDDDLIGRVMGRYGLRTKREAVDFALRRVLGGLLTLEEARAMEGSGWFGDLDLLQRGERLEQL